MNGADLVFASVREKIPAQLFKAMISYQIFEGGPLGKVETNQNNAIHVPAGTDSFSKIGEPEGAGQRSRVSFEKLWQEIIESQFEKVVDQQDVQTTKLLTAMAKYSDERVDNMRKQKDEELKQEIERSKRFESKQPAPALTAQK